MNQRRVLTETQTGQFGEDGYLLVRGMSTPGDAVFFYTRRRIASRPAVPPFAACALRYLQLAVGRRLG